ncbi:unnamed protein product [Eruca vesicaria subsp. sativa]|uniref:Gnk2-homologous domain-containing protein n=1 Tax=Eruca vesicaria subsp. sativa TaxID=29727 RepID=A0ABC8LZM4_ERUVS|nr:unnamed protein product [Eruca vesicaria subsp. sativa]
MQFLIIHSVFSLNLTNEYLNHKCLLNQGKYNFGSEYEYNLNSIIDYIRTSPYGVGSTKVSRGNTTANFAQIIVQCRGDSYGNKISFTCFDTAISGFRKRCPNNKGGMIWYDQCFLYVSTVDVELPGNTIYKNIFSMHNPKKVRGDTKLFANRAIDFLSELTLKLQKPNNILHLPVFYAAGEKKVGKNTLYAMVQCLDVSLDCTSCLKGSITKLFKKNDIKQGARVLGSNCFVRYELYPFLRS